MTPMDQRTQIMVTTDRNKMHQNVALTGIGPTVPTFSAKGAPTTPQHFYEFLRF